MTAITITAVMSLLLVVALLFMLRPFREWMLDAGLAKARARLPGTLVVGRSSWAGVGRVELQQIVWSDGADTLFAADSIAVALDLEDLLHRDLRLERLHVVAGSVDVPHMAAAFPPSGEQPTAEPHSGWFPRAGAIPGVPSVAIDSLALRIGRLRVTSTMLLQEIAARASFDLSSAHGPRLQIPSAAARDARERWVLTVADLEIDGERGWLSGEATAKLDSFGTLRVELATEADGELQARAALGPGAAGDRGQLVLQLAGRPDRRRLRLRSMPYEAQLSIPPTAEFSRWAGPVRRAEKLPALDSLRIDAAGVVTLRPQFGITLQASATPRGWLETLHLQLDYRDGSLRVDSLRVGLPGLRADARARKSHDGVEAQAAIDIDNARWISLLSPEATIPESLVATIRGTAHGALHSPALQLRLGAAACWRGTVVDACSLTAIYPDGVQAPGTVQLTLGARGLRVATEARLALVVPVHAELAPIRVRTLDRPGTDRPPPVPERRSVGRVDFDPESGDLQVDGVCIVGALGEATLRADLQQFLGSFGVDWEWNRPPPGLPRLLGLQAAAWDSVSDRWEEGAYFGIHVSGTRQTQADSTQTRVAGEIRLPGPHTCAPLVGSAARLDAYGPLEASLSARLLEWGGIRSWSAHADFAPTAWLRSTPLRVRGGAESIEIEELQLGLADLTLALSATLRDSVLHAHTHVVLDGGDLLRQFAILDEADTLHVEATGTLEGTIRDPRVELGVEAGGRYDTWSSPELTGRVARDSGRWSARLEASNGISGPLPLLQLDDLSLAFHSEQPGTDPFPASLRFQARGPELSMAYKGVVTRGPGWEVRGDTLGFAVRGQDLRSSRPFVVGMREGLLEFEDLSFAGSLGRVEVAGVVGRDSVDLAADVALQLGGHALVPALPPTLWPQRIELHVQAHGPQSFELEGTIEDFTLGNRPRLVSRIEAHTDSSRVATHVEILDGSNSLLSGRASVPDPWKQAARSPGTFEAQAELAGFPVPWEFLGRAGESMPASTLNAHLQASGTTAQPRAAIAVGIQVPVGTGPPAAMRAALTLGSAGHPFAATPEVQGLDLRRVHAIRTELGGYGMAAVLQLGRAGKNELAAEGAIPLQTTATGRLRIDASRPLRLHVAIPGLELAEWRELLPRGSSLDGRVVGSFDVRGAVDDPKLEGSLTVPQVTLGTRDGSRAVGQGEMSLRGSGRQPVIRGRMTVINGLVPIPEAPRKLLPVEGPSLLREATGAAADSVPAEPEAAPEQQEAPTQHANLPIQPDVDIELVVPSGCWVKGRNLAVELSGKLRLRLQGAEPTVLGELEARQGTLVFLGRTFQLDRGQVQFFGEDETNPRLDVRLSTKISSTTVRILVSGTAKEPEVDLVSEPAMSQSDIMSLLVFGRSKEELNGDELQLVAQRSAAIAATWGAAELQGLSGTLGVDMLQLQPGATPSGESSVVVGKYLSERALLKYEQALDTTTGFFVALQYTLTRDLSLETLAGTWQSGAELNWSKDY